MLQWLFENNVPDAMKPADNSLSNKANQFIQEWRQGTINIQYLKSPERCPAKFLDELDYFLQADVLENDSEEIARQKIYNAKYFQKRRYTFGEHIKILIDNITGLDSSIVDKTTLDQLNDAIYIGSSNYDNDDVSVLAGSSNYLDGIILGGSSNSFSDSGYVLIDLGGDISDPSEDERKQIVNSILEDPPAFLYIILGYIDSGNFVSYPTYYFI